ncbi:alpha/beta fold hydrolase [Noviherbaspirillum pedocola]|uniref:Alpha/beta hydrolase n=1 Tax=Noviherbaspirillum pedocola TaxID=2801341 RepID=A0A934SZ99_9BURK|nr:alpha/beta hydrolase [Noviherbaspirillum pedocola]MBK4735722.1 alpha/beta hydrolase [Noviherbaspirillum pedocola]
MAVDITEGQYAQLPNGTRLHYASAGERGKPLMLFLHGFPEFWYEWHEQLAEFGADHYAVAPDLRGFNLSDMPADPAAYKAKLLIEDIAQLIAHLGYERCVLIAHDWGGALAWSFAIARPALLDKLVIINAPHPYLFMRALAEDPAQQKASAYMNWLRSPGSETALAKDEFAMMDGFLSGMGQPPAPWFVGETRAKYHAAWSHGLTGGVNYYRASPLYPPTEADPGAQRLLAQMQPADFRVKVPTRVIWGESDVALPKSLLDGLDGFVDALEVVRIPEGTHWVVHEQPKRINRLIREALPD